jgi:phage FluMu protein Com
MKKCPVCNKEIKTYSLNIQPPLRNTIKCPHCGKLLRKKFSIWFIPVVLFIIISFILFNLHWAFHILVFISIIVYLIFMYKLPYVPYNK